jgi:hypothetical protein
MFIVEFIAKQANKVLLNIWNEASLPSGSMYIYDLNIENLNGGSDKVCQLVVKLYSMLNIRTGSGTASNYGSDSTKKMRLHAPPAPQNSKLLFCNRFKSCALSEKQNFVTTFS